MIQNRILSMSFGGCLSKRVQADAPGMIIKANSGLLDTLERLLPISPTSFIEHINQRHLLYIMTAFLESPNSSFNDCDEVASMWMHEVCRSVLDRYSDQKLKTKLFREIK